MPAAPAIMATVFSAMVTSHMQERAIDAQDAASQRAAKASADAAAAETLKTPALATEATGSAEARRIKRLTTMQQGIQSTMTNKGLGAGPGSFLIPTATGGAGKSLLGL